MWHCWPYVYPNLLRHSWAQANHQSVRLSHPPPWIMPTLWALKQTQHSHEQSQFRNVWTSVHTSVHPSVHPSVQPSVDPLWSSFQAMVRSLDLEVAVGAGATSGWRILKLRFPQNAPKLFMIQNPKNWTLLWVQLAVVLWIQISLKLEQLLESS